MTEALPARPSFGFARRHGATIVAFEAETAQVACRRDVKPDVLAELRRHARRPLQLDVLEAEAWEHLLRSLYEGVPMMPWRWLPIWTMPWI